MFTILVTASPDLKPEVPARVVRALSSVYRKANTNFVSIPYWDDGLNQEQVLSMLFSLGVFTVATVEADTLREVDRLGEVFSFSPVRPRCLIVRLVGEDAGSFEYVHSDEFTFLKVNHHSLKDLCAHVVEKCQGRISIMTSSNADG